VAYEEQARAEHAGEGFIRISNRELYDLMTQVRDRVVRNESRIEILSAESATQTKKIRGLELRFYGIGAGLLAALVVLLKVGGVPV
jgi:hypothetical protein